MSKPRDYGYEALAEATNTDMDGGRGELNIALKHIRAQSPALEYAALADEIHRRARMYRDVMGPDIMLTPTALAKHWARVLAESAPSERGVNRNAGASECETCGGDRFVLFEVREKGADVMAACPACNHSDYSYWRYDGTRFRQPDSALVQEYLTR